AMHRSRADVRYGIWLAASVKFLVPFASLSAAGAAIGARWFQPPAPVAPAVAPEPWTVELATAQLTQALATFATPAATEAPDVPFSWITAAAVVWILGALFVCVRWWAAWRRVAAAARGGRVMRHSREARIVGRLGGRLPVIECSTTVEPGVFGAV